MRALPVSPVPEMPDFMLGLSMIRGAPVPVVDTARLVGVMQAARMPLPGDDNDASVPPGWQPDTGPPPPSRYIALALGGRSVALAVDDVIGVRNVPAEELADVAPLLDGVEDGFVRAIAALDHELLLVLRAGRLVPDAMWATLAAGSVA